MIFITTRQNMATITGLIILFLLSQAGCSESTTNITYDPGEDKASITKISLPRSNMLAWLQHYFTGGRGVVVPDSISNWMIVDSKVVSTATRRL
jgi:hypothetical protein